VLLLTKQEGKGIFRKLVAKGAYFCADRFGCHYHFWEKEAVEGHGRFKGFMG
jgi:hypothetical protein